jgi:threonyl-tRNA synthetase
VSERYNGYAESIQDQLKLSDVRVFTDDRNEKVGKKIRDNEVKRIPYMLIVGEREAQSNTVSVRKQGEGDIGVMSIEEFSNFINQRVAEELK